VQRDPEGAIKGGEPRPGSRSGVDGELLAKGKLDDRLLPATSEEGQNTAKKWRREAEQGLHGARDSARFPGSARV
jgi:hypothetical protein